MKYNLQRANIFSPARKALKRAKIIANAVDSIKEKVRNLSDQQLTNKTNEFVNRLNAGETLDDILVEALAVARETVYRVNGMFAYKVQLIGSIIIH
jgi:preprotein translocase subunit SecA